MINVAVIGVGAMGYNHARTYNKLPQTKLVAVCDLSKKLGKKVSREFGVPYYEDYKEMIALEKLDAVSVVVPTKFHFPVSIVCMKKGLNVLVEKPITDSVEDAREMLRVAKKNNVHLMVGHIERYNPVVISLQNFIKNKEFGKILSIVIKRVGLNAPKNAEVDVVTDLAIHDLDIIMAILGKYPNSVYAKGGSMISRDFMDHAEIFLDYQKFGCFIQVNWVTPIKIRTLSITGTKGYAELNYLTQELNFYKHKREKKNVRRFEKFIAEYGKPEMTDVAIKKEEPLVVEIKFFCGMIESKINNYKQAEESINSLRLAVDVSDSIRAGRPVKL